MRNKLLLASILVCISASTVAYANGAVGVADECQFTFRGNVGSRSWSLADKAHSECRLNESLAAAGRQNEARTTAYQMWKDDQPQRITVERK